MNNDDECRRFDDSSDCGGYGGYNQSASATAKKLDGNYAYEYYGGINRGDFVSDTLIIGGATVNDMKMGIVTGKPHGWSK